MMLPPPDISAAYVDEKNRPSKDFYNWVKSIDDSLRGMQAAITNPVIDGYFGITGALSFGVESGDASGPYTTSDLPTVYIVRTEQIAGPTTAYSAALTVVSAAVAQNSLGAATSQTHGVLAYAVKDATSQGDTVAIFGSGRHSGLNGTAFGAFFESINSNNANSNSITVETQTTSAKAGNAAYNPTPGTQPAVIGMDLNYSNTAGNFLGGPAIQVRASGAQWDVGIGFMNSDPINKAEIQSDTNADNILLANSGSHVNGLDLSGATYSGSQIKLAMGANLKNAANDAAAAGLGVVVGEIYRNGSVLMVRVA